MNPRLTLVPALLKTLPGVLNRGRALFVAAFCRAKHSTMEIASLLLTTSGHRSLGILHLLLRFCGLGLGGDLSS